MTPYVNEITGQCGFRKYLSIIDRIFSIRQILENKWEYNNEVCQLSIDFEKVYDSLIRGLQQLDFCNWLAEGNTTG